jgi:hypothetical protein
MLRIALLLVVAITGMSCQRRLGKGTQATVPPGSGTVVQPDRPESRLHHPADRPLRAVPILIGFPTKQMAEQQRQGKALLGGCVGSPDRPPVARVCDQCRMWKTDEMKYWQPLPRDFGEAAARGGG